MSPATSAARLPSTATASCGWSTRASRPCARSTATTVSYRAGALLRHRIGGGRPLSFERTLHAGWQAAFCHCAGQDRHQRRMACRQGHRRHRHRRAEQGNRGRWPVDAALATLARRQALGAGKRQGNGGHHRPCHRALRNRCGAARLYARPGILRRFRLRRFVAGAGKRL